MKAEPEPEPEPETGIERGGPAAAASHDPVMEMKAEAKPASDDVAHTASKDRGFVAPADAAVDAHDDDDDDDYNDDLVQRQVREESQQAPAKDRRQRVAVSPERDIAKLEDYWDS